MPGLEDSEPTGAWVSPSTAVVRGKIMTSALKIIAGRLRGGSSLVQRLVHRDWSPSKQYFTADHCLYPGIPWSSPQPGAPGKRSPISPSLQEETDAQIWGSELLKDIRMVTGPPNTFPEPGGFPPRSTFRKRTALWPRDRAPMLHPLKTKAQTVAHSQEDD
ncbi:uncharacterized protein LOC135361573 isoform X2 [Mirounga angustirostris]|uniref:uncharacterized protein LOC135361573 isoform X2 n=1 Tax=Mirounga angustirostris TaxID=9716 RepID=UPI00313E052E